MSITPAATSSEVRQQRIAAGTPLVIHIAVSIWKSKRADCRLEDLIQSGMVGLIEACDSYDALRPSRRPINTPFLGWAANKIRWAIRDDQNNNSLRSDSFEGTFDSCDGAPASESALFDRCDPEPLPESVCEVREAIRWLPQPHRSVVLWRLDGLTHAAVGRRLGITRETARKFERQAFQALRYRSDALPAVLRRAA